MIPDINLLRRVDRRESNSMWLTAIIVIVVLAFGLAIYWFAAQYQQEIDDLRNKQQLLQTQKKALEDEYDQLVKHDRDLFAETVAYVEGISYPVSPIFDEISKLLPPQAKVQAYSFATGLASVKFDISTITAISAYTASLENSSYFQDVQLDLIENNVVETTSQATDEDPIVIHQQTYFTADYQLKIDESYLAARGQGNAK